MFEILATGSKLHLCPNIMEVGIIIELYLVDTRLVS